MANGLRYVAFQLSNHAATFQMHISEMRRILSEYFGRVLDAQKQSIHDNGHLSPLDVHSLEQTAAEPRSSALRQSLKEQVQRDALDNWDLNRILEGLGIPYDFDDDTRRQFVNEYRRADAAYARAVLDYDSSLDTYSFGLPSGVTEQTAISVPKADRTSLAMLVAEFWKFSKLEERWIDKTEGEKQEHIELLYEVLGRDRVADMGPRPRQDRAPPPKGLKKDKAEWLKPGLVGRVKFLKGEEKLRHATLKDFREET